jgi:hypothetical protein
VDDTNPWGWHIKACIDYYRDYGETLEATFCHDITKNYVYEEVMCDNSTYLESKLVNQNCIQLQWSTSTDTSFIRGYHVYRNNERITNELLANVSYLDKNLPVGIYEYYVRTYYKEGCVSDSSNYVEETIEMEGTCEPVNDLSSEKCNDNCVLLTWSEPESLLDVEGYHIYRDNVQLTNYELRENTYLDENLPVGEYEYYVVTYYETDCISDTSNHVVETVELGIKEFGYGIAVYPNPTTGELQVTGEQVDEWTSVEIFDVYGRKVFEQKAEGRKQKAMDISELRAGLYFVKITTEQGAVVRKVVKY